MKVNASAIPTQRLNDYMQLLRKVSEAQDVYEKELKKLIDFRETYGYEVRE